MLILFFGLLFCTYIPTFSCLTSTPPSPTKKVRFNDQLVIHEVSRYLHGIDQEPRKNDTPPFSCIDFMLENGLITGSLGVAMHVSKSFANKEPNGMNSSQMAKMFVAVSCLNLVIRNKDYIINSIKNNRLYTD